MQKVLPLPPPLIGRKKWTQMMMVRLPLLLPLRKTMQ